MYFVFCFFLILFSPISGLEVTIDEIYYWDGVVDQLVKDSTLPDGEENRLITYLYNAQQAFATASTASSGKLDGSLDPISLAIIKLFFPNYQNIDSATNMDDPYTNKLAEPIAKQFTERFQLEQKQIHSPKIILTKDSWRGTEPFYGTRILTMKPWVLSSKSEFRCPDPGTEKSFWDAQLNEVINQMFSRTKNQNKQILYWAGKLPEKSGDWIVITKNYMDCHNLPLKKQIEVRSNLATTLFDNLLATFDSKYTFLVKRPFMLDPSLKPYIPTPDHPSYPAGHSTTGAAAAAVLTYYFPENKDNWEQLAEDCGMSRIRAGIHFPIDDAAGTELGEKVATKVLRVTTGEVQQKRQ